MIAQQMEDSCKCYQVYIKEIALYIGLIFHNRLESSQSSVFQFSDGDDQFTY
jgi:hypothetical protein